MTLVYVAIGSNLREPLQQVNAALAALDALPHTHVIQCSPFYRTKPLGPQDQPDYLNAVVALETQLSPEALLAQTQHIELMQGRERKAERWGPRTLDLDILLFGQMTVNTPTLTIPHYDMKNREFMLYPLFDIAPDCVLPDGTVLAQHLKQIPINGMTLWSESA